MPELTRDDVTAAVARATGIPVARVDAVGVADRERLLGLEEVLARRVVGQDAAVEAVADAVRAGRAGLAAPGRPVGSLLFVGPPGVGKTELARALADALHHSEPVRFDMGEFADPSSLTRLLGAPPGHVGHDEPGQLTEALRRDPYAVLLFDEVEKAHREVTGALLALLDAGRLTDAHGRSVDATHAVVVLTSNLGAELILGAPGGDVEAVREPVLALARVVLRPELVNRVDEVVLFAPLSAQALAAITDDGARRRPGSGWRTQGVGLAVSDAAVAWLGGRGAGGPKLGARPLRRTVAREVDRQAVADAAGGRGPRRGRGAGGRRPGDRRGGAGWPSRSAAMAEAERHAEPDEAPDAAPDEPGRAGSRRSGGTAGASSPPARWCGRGTTTSSARRPRPRSGRRCRCRRCCWGCSGSSATSATCTGPTRSPRCRTRSSTWSGGCSAGRRSRTSSPRRWPTSSPTRAPRSCRSGS